jgi:hypothetical protein
VCVGKHFQCQDCQRSDDAARKALRAAKAKAKAKAAGNAIQNPLAGPPSGLSEVYVIPDAVAEMTKGELDFVFQKQPGTVPSHRMLFSSHANLQIFPVRNRGRLLP